VECSEEEKEESVKEEEDEKINVVRTIYPQDQSISPKLHSLVYLKYTSTASPDHFSCPGQDQCLASG